MESTKNDSQLGTMEIDSPVITSTSKNGKQIDVVIIKSESEHDTGNLNKYIPNLECSQTTFSLLPNLN